MHHQDVEFLNKIDTSSATGQNLQNQLEEIIAKIESHDFRHSDDKLASVYCDVIESLQEKEGLLITNEDNTSIEE